MTAKLLEKSRNIFLSLTPPENLIPKKRVKANKKNRYQKNRIKNSRAPLSSLSKFFHQKRHIANVHITNKPVLDNLSLENINIIPPINHSAKDELHFAIGGNINRFLSTQPERRKSGSSTPVHLKDSHFVHLNGSHFAHLNGSHFLLKKAASENLLCETEELACLEKNTSISPFFLKWDQENLFLTDFIKGQLYENIWKSLFSNYDLNYVYNTRVKNYKAPIRIKSQHKNELMEYRKISIFYGNLSRNYLTRLMKQSGGSKFLSTLERRLDVVLKRALFFPTIRGARQWIHQGKILVNNEICMYNSYLLRPGDLITIKERYKNIWRKEWFKSFKEFDFVHLNGEHLVHLEDSHLLRKKETHQRKTFHNPSTSVISPRGRFLFSSHLMRKWDKWCQLWGNSIISREGGHLWSRRPYTPNFSLHPAFNNSVCADDLYLKSFVHLKGEHLVHLKDSHLMRLKNNLYKLGYTCRQSTALLLWLEKLHRNSFPRKNQKNYMPQLISSLLLLQQRGRVIDGLFPQRWNRLFTIKKRKILKKKSGQWGGIKPMHLECSYSCATVIYLFTPQKLVWPSHINVLLLKSALKS